MIQREVRSMKRDELEELLMKQLQLLHEQSKDGQTDKRELVELTEAMASLTNALAKIIGPDI